MSRATPYRDRFARRIGRGVFALVAVAVVLGIATVVQAAPQPETGLGLPRDVSLDGHRIDWLIEITTIFVVILFVIVCIWILWTAFAHGPKHKAQYDHGDSIHHMNVAFFLSGIIFLIVDGNLLINSMMDLEAAFWNFSIPEANEKAVRVQVNAHQWAWDFRYPGADKQFNTEDDIVTLNELRVPVGAPIILQLGSVDVIHSFYLPNFRTKQDATPGHINHLWFQATQTGDFDIACAQHCGVNHYMMGGLLTVMEPKDYQQWHDEMSAEGVRRQQEAVRNGSTERFELQNWGWDWESARERRSGQ